MLTGLEVARESYFVSRLLVHADGLDGASILLAPTAAIIAFQLTCGLLMALLVFAVGRGKSWARWSFIVLAVFSILSGLAGAATKGVAATGWLALGDVAVDVLIVALLFARAARAWFAADRTQENKWRGRWVCMTWWGLFVLVTLTFVVVLAAAVAISEQACAKQPGLRAAIAKAQADVAATVFGSVRQAVPDIAAERRRQFGLCDPHRNRHVRHYKPVCRQVVSFSLEGGAGNIPSVRAGHGNRAYLVPLVHEQHHLHR